MSDVAIRPAALLLSILLVLGGCNRADESGSGQQPAQGVPATATEGPLRVYGTVPDFSLTDRQGNSFGTQQLGGKVWIADFIFTRCQSICPAMTSQMAKMQKELRNHPRWSDVRLVSFSVDPDHDTPAVLAQYAQDMKADPEHWSFLTGSRDEIWQLSKAGFKLAVGESPADSAMPIFHSPKFVLVDGQSQIRGFYDGLTEPGRAALKRDLERALEESSIGRIGHPEQALNPPWLAGHEAAQLATLDQFEVFHDFRFSDRVVESGISFQNQVTEDSGKAYKPVHYDHGNGITVADVNGDGLFDIYFTTQLGPNELWINSGDGNFSRNIESEALALADKISVTASFADTDNDGDPDLYVTTVRGGNFLFENDGQGRFTDVTEGSGLGYSGHSSGAIFFDYDRDGRLDLFLCNVGVYTTDAIGPGDYYVGFKDAFAGHLKPERNEPSVLFRNEGDNRFVDVTERMQLVDDSWSGDAAPIDVNEDGWPDLYVLNMQGHDQYYENVGGKYFEKKSRAVFRRTPWGSMGIDVFDFENDGDMDIFLTDMHSDMSERIDPDREKLKSRMEWSETLLRSGGMSIYGNAFFRNDGNGRFDEVSDQIGAENYWPWGLSVGDLNADGYEDAFIASSMNLGYRYGVNSVLLNNRGKKFLDSEFILGVEPRPVGRTAKPWFELDCPGKDIGHDLCSERGLLESVVIWGARGSRASVIFDVDSDGDLDIVTNEFNDLPLVLISNLSEKKELSYLKVRLIGSRSNRDGLGARVEVHAGSQTYVRVHDGKSGYLSQSIKPLYFGMHDAGQVDGIEVAWPSGQKQSVPGPIAVNRLIDITEP